MENGKLFVKGYFSIFYVINFRLPYFQFSIINFQLLEGEYIRKYIQINLVR